MKWMMMTTHMKRRQAAFFGVLAAVAFAGGADAGDFRLEQVYSKVAVERPVALVLAPDGSGRKFLVQQRGKVLILPGDETSGEVKTFLDFTGRKMEAPDGQFEEGLLGLAFHPKFAENRKFYVYYSQQDMKRSVISEIRVSSADPDLADVARERVLLEIPQPYWNHNSGNLLFGPDGFLYIGVGDGGKRDDVARTAQNRFLLQGKILRLDVDRQQGSRAYGIPADNPWVGKAGVREEVFAYGLRNPWGLSFDGSGRLWVADVRQDLWEEINLVKGGGNYGWSFRDGARANPLRTDAPPDDVKFVNPIHEYSHADGISVTGGFVYDGENLPGLKGKYVYGDWGSGRLWALRYDHREKKVISNEALGAADGNEKDGVKVQPTAFAQDGRGGIYVLDWNGRIFRLVK